METIDPSETVASIALRVPSAARTFERFGIDYCCKGRVPLSVACSERKLAVRDVLDDLADQLTRPSAPTVVETEVAPLIEYIVERHHAYTREALARLAPLATKVLGAHGARHPELQEVAHTLRALADDLLPHMLREELVLFPYMEQLTRGDDTPPPFGTIGNPLRAMLREHEAVGALVEKLHALTSGYQAPRDACTSYRMLYAGLEHLSADIHMHVHLENNVLFPQAAQLEQRMRAR
jgi:regulator of cell morphogenesis and NO signaling